MTGLQNNAIVHMASGPAAKRFIRFVVVGIVNTALGYGLYLLFLFSGIDYRLSFGLALGIMLVVGFWLSGYVVFGRLQKWRFPLYVGSWLGIYFCNILALEWLVSFGLSKEIAPLIVLPFNVLASYVVQKLVVFR